MSTQPLVQPAARSERARALSDAALRDALVRFMRSRLPEAEVDDAVQETLADALAAANAPESNDQLRGWVHGIARHKVADYYRRREHTGSEPNDDIVDPREHTAPLDARDLLEWAHGQAGRDPAQQATLEWMLREGDGDQLQQIAEEEEVPAARVRQRVSRLRRVLRTRWATELSAAAGVAVIALLVVWLVKSHREPPPIAKEPVHMPSPDLERARRLREAAERDCAAERWRECIAGLDAAQRLDSAGDRTAHVTELRHSAEMALAQPTPLNVAPATSAAPPPSPTSSPTPSVKSKAPSPKRPNPKTSSDFVPSSDDFAQMPTPPLDSGTGSNTRKQRANSPPQADTQQLQRK